MDESDYKTMDKYYCSLSIVSRLLISRARLLSLSWPQLTSDMDDDVCHKQRMMMIPNVQVLNVKVPQF